MTAINDISDLVRVLQERPDWLAAVRNLVVGEELLNLPQQLAQFVKTTEENFRLVNERLDRLESRMDGLEGRMVGLEGRMVGLEGRMDALESRMDGLESRMARLEVRMDHLEGEVGQLRGLVNHLGGRVGNLEGHNYERRVRTRILLRMTRAFGMDDPYVALHQEGRISPELNRLYTRAAQSDAITPDELDDLQDVDIIISDAGNRLAVVEVSLTADNDDVERAARRARILATAAGSPVLAAVATANLSEPQRSLAEARDVTVFVFPDR